MEAVPLDLDGYAGSYKLVGGRVCLDLVNTVSWPGTPREHDWLRAEGNVPRWLSAAGLDSHTMPTPPGRLRSLRKVLDDLVRPFASGLAPDPSAVVRFNALLQPVMASRHLDVHTLTWRLEPDTNPALAELILDAADLVTESSQRAIKACPECSWLFVDQSRNGRRRWCDMADCGSRVKARSHYHRTKSAPTASDR